MNRILAVRLLRVALFFGALVALPGAQTITTPGTIPPRSSGSSGAPADATYITGSADGTLSAEQVLGTTVITTAAEASKPAAASAGRLFFPSDGFYFYRDSGSEQTAWGPFLPLTPPVSADYAWINQGSATITTTNGGVFIQGDSTGTFNIRLRKKAAPATPYTVTMGFIPLMVQANYHAAGLAFREVATGELEVLSFATSDTSQTLQIERYNSPTSYGSQVLDVGFARNGPLAWLCIADNGTNRVHSVSTDGKNFQTVNTVSRVTFLTADEWGFFVRDQNTTYPSGMTVLHLKEGTTCGQ